MSVTQEIEPWGKTIRVNKVVISDAHKRILSLYSRPMTDEQMIVKANMRGFTMSHSGLRSRRAELVKAGFLMDTGKKQKTVNGRPARVWGRATR